MPRPLIWRLELLSLCVDSLVHGLPNKWPARSKYEERIGTGMGWISDNLTVNTSNLYELAEAIPIEGGEPTQKLILYAPLAEEFGS